MQRRFFLITSILVVVLAGAGLWYALSRPQPATQVSSGAASTTPSLETSSSTSEANPKQAAPAVPSSFPINPADTLVSWDFAGVNAGNAALRIATDADRAKLTALLGKGQYDDYDLYIGLGNDASLEGEGSGAYMSYNKAAAIRPNKGLAYANLGNLFDELGAYHTAADAYAKAVRVEPGQLQYHLSRLNFLVRRFPTDSARITVAFADAYRQFGDTAPVLTIKAQWFEGQGRYADAITTWQMVKQLSSADRQAAIDAQIARDRIK
ncbi:MAG: hypothetical protein Q7S95_03465 [bacterium]|nr:hypothetical protein [bacterium]